MATEPAAPDGNNKRQNANSPVTPRSFASRSLDHRARPDTIDGVSMILNEAGRDSPKLAMMNGVYSFHKGLHRRRPRNIEMRLLSCVAKEAKVAPEGVACLGQGHVDTTVVAFIVSIGGLQNTSQASGHLTHKQITGFGIFGIVRNAGSGTRAEGRADTRAGTRAAMRAGARAGTRAGRETRAGRGREHGRGRGQGVGWEHGPERGRGVGRTRGRERGWQCGRERGRERIRERGRDRGRERG